jgi:ribosome silencing factor RsfS/YbeB/iojap
LQEDCSLKTQRPLKTQSDSEGQRPLSANRAVNATSKSAPRKSASAKPSVAKPAAKKPTAAKKSAPNKGSTASKSAARFNKGKPTAAKTLARKGAAKPKSTAVAKPTRAKPIEKRAAPVDKGPEALAPVVATLRRSVISALEEMKAKDVVEIDIRGKASFADLLFIASGTSTRHVKSLADEVVKFVKKAGMMPLGVEGQKEAEWVLVDLGDIVCHLMLPRIRDFYAIERMWSVGGDHEASND